MHGLLLVEDEEAIKNKLMHNVPWSEYGFNPVLGASNGQEALALLEKHPVAIMVTDIQMPVMNGIELIKEIKKRAYRMKIIVISGYAEFEYARESINLAVSEYLLKPFATKRLLAVALRLQKEIQNERAEEYELQTLRRQVVNNRSALKEKFLTDLLHRKVATTEISAKLRLFDLAEYEDRDYQVVVMERHDEQGESAGAVDKNGSNLQFFRQAERLLDQTVHSFLLLNYDQHQLVALCFAPDQVPAQGFLPDLEEVLQKLKAYFDRPFTFGVSNCYRGLQDLSVAYQEAKVALQYRYIHGLNRVYAASALNLDYSGYQKSFYQLYQHRVFDDLRIGADLEIRDDLKQLFAEIRSAHFSPETIRIIAANLVLLTYATLNELGYRPEEIFERCLFPFREINSTQSLSQLEELLRNFFARINCLVAEKRDSLNQQKIEGIRCYVEEHYASELSLTDLAKEHQLSPSYLSQLFAEQTGKKFIDYLTDCRIGKAKELLKHTELRIYEIAAAVGYKDPYYFSNCFKKITGLTPSEYREGLN